MDTADWYQCIAGVGFNVVQIHFSHVYFFDTNISVEVIAQKVTIYIFFRFSDMFCLDATQPGIQEVRVFMCVSELTSFSADRENV